MATNTYMHAYELEIFTIENNEILTTKNKYRSLDIFIPNNL